MVSSVELSYVDALAARRLRWRARRGLLENDLILKPFLDRFLDPDAVKLTALQCECLERLLLLPDPQLLEFLLGHQQSNDDELQVLIDQIRGCS